MEANKMREEFESWYFRRFGMTDLSGAWAMERWEAWVEAWRASRAAVVVQMPAEWMTNVGKMLPPPAIRRAIEAQGLKVAP